MSRLVFLALFVLVETEELLGVNYSFDLDFYTDFNSKRCGNVNMWRLVSCDKIDIEPHNSDNAIQAAEESCASSFSIIFVGGTLDVNVYSQDISQMFDLRIEVFDEDDQCITSYRHDRSRKDFEPGWQIVSLKINKHVKGYIRFRGRSLNSMLLIDSFQYTPNNTVIYSKRFKRRITEIEEDGLIFTEALNVKGLESSGDGENGSDRPPATEEPDPESPATEEPDQKPPSTDQPDLEPSAPERRDTFWNPFTISLVSLGVFVVVALFVVGAYHYGKIKAINRSPLPFVDEEPPRTITIPRVTGRSNRASPSMLYDQF